MKIKTKKEMNLSELIEWIWNNDLRDNYFYSQEDESWLRIDEYGDVVDVYNIEPTDTFTVEVEEEITEDMEFHHTVERFISRYVNKYRYETHDNKSIKDILNNRPPHVETTHIYAEVDKELVLIWRDGRLVK